MQLSSEMDPDKELTIVTEEEAEFAKLMDAVHSKRKSTGFITWVRSAGIQLPATASQVRVPSRSSGTGQRGRVLRGATFHMSP